MKAINIFFIIGIVFVSGFCHTYASTEPSIDDLIQKAAVAYRQGRLYAALADLTKILEREPENATVKNYIWTIAKKIQREDAESSLTKEDIKDAVQLAVTDLEGRRAETEAILKKLQTSYNKSRNLRSPSDILSSMEGLDKFVEKDFATERAEEQARLFFANILSSVSTAIDKNVFVSKKDQYKARGYLAYYQQKWGKASHYWKKALKEDPGDEKIKSELKALILLRRKKKNEEKVKELVRQAKTFYNTGYTGEAVKTWKQVLKLDAAYPGAKEQLTVSQVAYEKKKQQRKLKKMTNEGIKKYKSGDYLAGAEIWLKALQIDPTYQQAREWLTLVGKKLKSLESKTDFTAKKPASSAKSASAKPSSAGAVDHQKALKLYKQGILLYSQEKLADAVALWKKALSYDPNLAKAREAIKQAQAELAFYQ